MPLIIPILLCTITVHSNGHHIVRMPSAPSLSPSEIAFSCGTLATPNFGLSGGISKRAKVVGRLVRNDYTDPFSTPYPRQSDFRWLEEAAYERSNWCETNTTYSLKRNISRAIVNSAVYDITNANFRIIGIKSPPSSGYYLIGGDFEWAWTDWMESAEYAAISACGGDPDIVNRNIATDPSLMNHSWISKSAFEPICDYFNRTHYSYRISDADLPCQAFNVMEDYSYYVKWTTNIGDWDWKYATSNDSWTAKIVEHGGYTWSWYSGKRKYQAGHTEGEITQWSDWLPEETERKQYPTPNSAPWWVTEVPEFMTENPDGRITESGVFLIAIFSVSNYEDYGGQIVCPSTTKYVAYCATATRSEGNANGLMEYFFPLPSVETIFSTAGWTWGKSATYGFETEHIASGHVAQVASYKRTFAIVTVKNQCW